MSDTRKRFLRRQLRTVASLLMVAAFFGKMSGQQGSSDLAQGSGNPATQTFAVNCAACHGLDGSGTQRAPNIVSGASVQKLSSADLLRIISDGVPGTGMPAFRSLGEDRLKAIVEYLRNLQGKNSAQPVHGNPEQGKAVFVGKGGCSACHMISGSGGFIAPDLTGYAGSHSPERIKTAITDSSARDSAAAAVTVTTADSRRYHGIVRNEDNFSLQLQSMDGSFHFFNKSALKRIDRDSASIMPADYGAKLTSAELDDLVSYLLSLSTSTPTAQKDKDDE